MERPFYGLYDGTVRPRNPIKPGVRAIMFVLHPAAETSGKNNVSHPHRPPKTPSFRPYRVTFLFFAPLFARFPSDFTVTAEKKRLPVRRYLCYAPVYDTSTTRLLTPPPNTLTPHPVRSWRCAHAADSKLSKIATRTGLRFGYLNGFPIESH